MSIWNNRYVKVFCFAFSVAAVFSVLGVYDSDRSPMLSRFAIWAVTISVGTAISLYTVPRVLRGPLKDSNVSIQISVIALIMSVPITLIVVLIKVNGDAYSITLSTLGTQFALVFVISVLITTLGLTYWRRWFGNTLPTHEIPVFTRKFRNRLATKHRNAELIAVSAEDHYVRAHTSIGNELILMRFSDALQELVEEDGMRVHRSWWVSRKHIAGKRREKRRLILELASGVEAPVARSSMKEVVDWASLE